MADSNAIQILIEAQSRAQAGFDKAKAETAAFKQAVEALGPSAGASGAELNKMLADSQQRLTTAAGRADALDTALRKLGVTGQRSGITAANAIEVLANSMRRAHDPASALLAAFSSFGKIGLAIAGVGVALGAAGAAPAAALAGAGRVEELQRLAEQAGATTAEIQILQRSLQNLGIGGGDATVAMTTLARQISEGNPLLGQLGITSRNAYQAMLQLGSALERVKDPADRTRIVFELTGRGGAQMTGIMRKLGEETAHVGAIFGEFGGSITKMDEQGFGNLDRRMDDLATRVDALRLGLARLGLPTAEFMLKQIDKLMRGVVGLRAAMDQPLGQNFVADALKGIGDLARGVDWLIGRIHAAGDAYGDLGSRVAKGLGDRLGLPNFVADLRDQVEKLNAAQAGFLGPDESGGDGGGADIDVDFDTTKSSAREERLKEIQRLLKLLPPEAEKVLKSLEAIEDAAAKTTILETLAKEFPKLRAEAKATDSSGASFFSEIRKAALATKDAINLTTKAATNLANELARVAQGTEAIPGADKLKPTPPPVPPEIGPELPEVEPPKLDPWREGIEQFRRDAEAMIDTANAVREALHGLAETFASSLTNVFQTMLFSAKDTGKAIIALVQNMVSEMIAQLIRLAVFKLFFNLFTGGAGSLGSTMGSPGFSYPVAATVGGAGSASAAAVQSGPERVTNVTVYAQALDMQSLASSFQDPYGAGRRHFARAFEVAAA